MERELREVAEASRGLLLAFSFDMLVEKVASTKRLPKTGRLEQLPAFSGES